MRQAGGGGVSRSPGGWGGRIEERGGGIWAVRAPVWWRDGTSLPESDRANNSLKRERCRGEDVAERK